MSSKRQATTDLNHDNWDQDDPSEHEDMGSFKSASKDVLEKRVIRTAKRRSQATDDEAKKRIFSGFGGFNKVQPSSFDFLANLTNGNKPSSVSPGTKSDTAVTSSLFGSQPVSRSPGGTFNTSTTTTKLTITQTPSPTSGFFKGTSANTTIGQSLFTASKADSTVGDSPFKIQETSKLEDATSRDSSKITAANNASTPQVSSTIFGTHSIGANTNKTLFSASNNSTPFKIQPVSSTTSPVLNNLSMKGNISTVNDSDTKKEDKKEEDKIKYHTKLRGLNESVSDWIKKHVEETPVCILTPIFRDYEKHLKDILDEYHGISEETINNSESDENSETTPSPTNEIENVLSNNDEGNSLFSKTCSHNPKPSVFGNQNTSVFGNECSAAAAALKEKSQSFSFGLNTTPINSSGMNTTSSGGFQFGINPSAQTTTAAFSSPFSSTTTANATAPFSFGIGKPFSFSPNIQKNTEQTKNDDKEEEDEPPKVEFTPVVEENSVYDKRCKIFVKKDGNFADKGVGTLYIKKVEESGKYQLLARANTNLGNVLLNLILTPSIATQRLGKNNVMMVCIPTPDTKPPPTTVLIRVKTSDEADELMNTLTKYKV